MEQSCSREGNDEIQSLLKEPKDALPCSQEPLNS